MGDLTLPYFIRFIAAFVIVFASSAFSQENTRCQDWSAQLVSMQGMVQWRSESSSPWQLAEINQRFCAGDSILVDANRATLKLANETFVRLKEGALVKLSPPKKTFAVRLLEGAAYFISRTPRAFSIEAPFLNAAIEGTEFLVSDEGQANQVVVYEGSVVVNTKNGEARAVTGEKITVGKSKNLALVKNISLVNSADWVLYFPPIISFEDLSPNIIDMLKRSRYSDALKLVSSSNEKTLAEIKLRASLLLYYGKLAEAENSIRQIDLRDGISSQALKLMLKLRRGDSSAAEKIAKSMSSGGQVQATPLAPLALSYYYQAQAELETALSFAQQATSMADRNPLAWARAAELALSVGKIELARFAINRARNLAPNFSRIALLNGYVALNELDYSQANKSFSLAVKLDPSDPLAQFSLGMARIRSGDLSNGREKIEMAIVLDPSNSLLRSYMGKAYAEEQRYSVAMSQYDLAQNFDPKDPTPWFYRGLTLFDQQQYIDAHQAIQESIIRNDNRAIYRSRQQLDSDNAIRNANLAGVYRALGLSDQARRQAANSLSSSPSEYSAHKMLASSLGENAREDISAASQLLQAQVRQPLTSTPLRSILSEQDLFVASGFAPHQLGINEFGSLFNTSGTKLQVALAGGNDSTNVSDVYISNFNDRFSVALESYRYKTDGFEDDYAREYDVSNLYLQAQVTRKLKLLFELRAREEDRKLLSENTTINNFENFEAKTNLGRFALQYMPNPALEVLAVIDLAKDDAELFRTDIVNPVIGITNEFDSESQDKIIDGEFQVTYTSSWYNNSFGAITSKIDREGMIRTELFGVPAPVPPPPIIEELDHEITYNSFYNYLNLSLNSYLDMSLGLSYAEFKDESVMDKSESFFNGKAGIKYSATDRLGFTLTYFEDLKKPLEIVQSLEPTHIQGINQFNDDVNFMKSRNNVARLDYQFTTKVQWFSEYTERHLDASYIENANDARIVERDINTGFHFVQDIFAFQASIHHSDQKFDEGKRTQAARNLPVRLDTEVLENTLNVFVSPNFTTSISANHIEQEVQSLPDDDLLIEGGEKFWLIDTSLRYSFLNKRVFASVEIKNITDKNFQFLDTNILDGTISALRFIPERTALFKINASF